MARYSNNGFSTQLWSKCSHGRQFVPQEAAASLKKRSRCVCNDLPYKHFGYSQVKRSSRPRDGAPAEHIIDAISNERYDIRC